MPVRIYDISKKLGLENKEILAKAKAMGIAAARVPSSSLDKISAEWLEEELLKAITGPAGEVCCGWVVVMCGGMSGKALIAALAEEAMLDADELAESYTEKYTISCL